MCMNYPLMETPFVLIPFGDMKKKQVEEYFQWYMSQIEDRIYLLKQFINQDTNSVLLNKTPESLIDLWEWFENHIEFEEKTEQDVQKELREQPEWFHEMLLQNTTRLTILTMELAEDIAIYFSETMIFNNSSVHWGYRMKPKKLDGVNRPILLGFNGDICVNPRRLVSVCLHRSSEKKNKYELYETYNIWVKNI